MNALFANSVPTKPDVDALMAKFGAPEEGKLIAYSEVEAVVNCAKGTFRFNTITNAWRKRLMRESNILLGCEAGKGFVRLEPNSRVEHGSKKITSGIRSVRRGATIVNSTERDRLTPENKRVAEHCQKLHSAIELARATEAQKIKLPGID